MHTCRIYNKIGHAVDQCIFDLIEYMMSQMVGLKFLSLAIYEIVNLQFLEELHTLLHFFKQKKCCSCEQCCPGSLVLQKHGLVQAGFLSYASCKSPRTIEGLISFIS